MSDGQSWGGQTGRWAHLTYSMLFVGLGEEAALVIAGGMVADGMADGTM